MSARDENSGTDGLTGPEAEALTAAILARTSGPACRAAEDRLPARADGLLALLDLRMVNEHLSYCRSCRALASALDWMQEALPSMTELDPGPRFVEEVLQHTSDIPAPAPGTWRIRDQWRALLRRPRVALETAYVAAMIAFLALGSPSPLVREIASSSAALPSRSFIDLILDHGDLNGSIESFSRWLGENLEPSSIRARGARVLEGAAATAATAEKIARTAEIAGGRLQAGAGAFFRRNMAGVWWNWRLMCEQVRAVWNPEAAALEAEPSAGPVRNGSRERQTETPDIRSGTYQSNSP